MKAVRPKGRESKMSAQPAVRHAPEILWRVGKHPKPLEAYPLLSQWLIRAVYFLTGYQTTSEDIAIASSEALADMMCLDGRYFYKPLYKDLALGDEQAAPGPVVWPRKGKVVQMLYRKKSPDMVAVPRHVLEQLGSKVEDVFHAAKTT